jgi:UDP-N-acetylmuramate dehydrogenase
MSHPLAGYTTMRVGGPADLLVVTSSLAALRRAVTLAWQNRAPYLVLGGGANVIVSDAGVRGLVVLNRARKVTVSRSGLKAQSGASLSKAARTSISHGLAGLEWAIGIPGTVGGALVGNAGAWGGDIASTLVQATMLEEPGVMAQWPVGRFGYGYRTSALKRQITAGRRQFVVLEAEFALSKTESTDLEARVARITSQRRATQPAGATCGSVFRNPPGDFAGRLIEAAGLKGRRAGDAEISTVHANFIVNHGSASAAEVKALIDLARETVVSKFGILLELEIQLVGAW